MASFDKLFGPGAGGYQPPQGAGAGMGIPGLVMGAQQPPPSISGLTLGQQAPQVPLNLQALLQGVRPMGPPRFDQLQSRLQNAGGGAGLGVDPMAARMMLMQRLGLLR